MFAGMGYAAISMEIKRCLFGKKREPAGQSWLPRGGYSAGAE
jgi:hypothetical protein